MHVPAALFCVSEPVHPGPTPNAFRVQTFRRVSYHSLGISKLHQAAPQSFLGCSRLHATLAFAPPWWLSRRPLSVHKGIIQVHFGKAFGICRFSDVYATFVKPRTRTQRVRSATVASQMITARLCIRLP